MSDWKAIDPLWNLADTLTVTDATALVAGFNPNAVVEGGEYFKNIETGLTDSEGIGRVATVHAAITNAINAGKLKAKIRYSSHARGWDEEPDDGEAWSTAHPAPVFDAAALLGQRNWIRHIERDWGKTTVDCEDLIAWLRSRGHTTGFFFPDEVSDAPDYLNSKHERYSPKLAAAVTAWQNFKAVKGKSAKHALDEWLRENAAAYGLTDDDGKPIEQAIEDMAKVANWETKGGAPKPLVDNPSTHCKPRRYWLSC